MKKKIVRLKDLANLGAIKRRVADAFSERGKEAADAIRALIDELEQSEVEVDEEALAEKIKEVLEASEPNTKTEEAIANAIAKRMQAITNTVKGKDLTPAVKNQISAAILRAHGKEEVKNEVQKVLVKNDVTGLTFEDVVDYAIVESWGDLNPIFAKLHKTMYTKFFYNAQELKTAALLAKQWDKTGESEKVIQELAATGKTITTRYIYKRQQLAQEDLDFDILKPLIAETAAKALATNDPTRVQTGPASRGDMVVTDGHQKMLSDDRRKQQIYKLITESIWETSKRI